MASVDGQVVANPAAGLAPASSPAMDASAAASAIADYGASGPRRRMVRRKTIAPDAGFTTFSTAMKAGWSAELQSRKFKQAVLAELVATAIFVAVGSASVVFSHDVRLLQGTFVPNGRSVTAAGQLPAGAASTVAVVPGSTFPYGYTAAAEFPVPRIIEISFVFGLMITVLVFATGSISGGNLNPAVTLSLALTGKMSGLRALCYVIAQCAGATAGSAFIYSLAPDLFDAAGGAANGVAWGPTVTTWTALCAEITGTALLLTTVSAAADVGREKNNKYQGALTPLIIGLAVLVAHLFLIPIDGCSINPARSFGSAVVARQFKDHWVFWVGPLIGGPLAAILYEYVFKQPPLSSGPGSPGPVMIESQDDPASLVLVESKDGQQGQGQGSDPLGRTASMASHASGRDPSASTASDWQGHGGAGAGSTAAEPANPFDAPQPSAGGNTRAQRIMAMGMQPQPMAVPVQRVAMLPLPNGARAGISDAYSMANNLA